MSLLEVGKDDDGFSTIQVRATSGDSNNLGGDDQDQRIVNWLVLMSISDRVKAKTGADLLSRTRSPTSAPEGSC